MRDPAITDAMIDKWLHDAVFGIIIGALQAEKAVGVVPLNDETIHGYVWAKYKVDHGGKQSTLPFQFFYRLSEADQAERIKRVVECMKGKAMIRSEVKAGRERFVPTTPLDELARIEGVEEGRG